MSKFENESTNGTNISTDICKIEIKEENVTGKEIASLGIHLQRNVVDREMIKESKQNQMEIRKPLLLLLQVMIEGVTGKRKRRLLLKTEMCCINW